MKRLLPILAVSVALLAGCGGDNPSQGGPRQACNSNGTCNAGLTCARMVCVDLRGTAGGDGGGLSGSAGSVGASGAAGTADGGGALDQGDGGADAMAGMTGQAGTGGSAGAGGGAGDGSAGTAGAPPSVDGSADVTALSDAGDVPQSDSGALDSSADGLRFDVFSLAGLVAWFDATKGVLGNGHPGKVSGWVDQSGNQISALALDPSVPSLAAGDVNGLPFIDFFSTRMNVLPTTKLNFGQADFAFEVVARWSSSVTAGATILLQVLSPAGTPNLTLFGDDNLGHAAVSMKDATVTSATSNIANGAFHVVGARRYGSGASSTLEIRVDGVVAGTMTGVPYGLDLSTSAGAQFGPGSRVGLAEIVMLKGPVAEADLKGLESHLLSKYGL